MPVNLKGRSFLTLMDFSRDEIYYLLDLAADLKAKKRAGIRGNALQGKNIALLFEKASTRTRCAFTVACIDEGAHPEFLGKNDIHLGGKEDVKDTARVLGRMFDGIEYRGFKQSMVEELAEYAGVPVWNGLTDVDHPTQILADFLTLQENFGRVLKGLRLVYCGDGRNNMSNALMIGCAKLGMHYVIASPASLFPEAGLLEQCRALAAGSGGSVTVFENPVEAVKGADAVYTDVWVSMGEPMEEFGLARQLACLLSTRHPGQRFEVVNAAMTAINSHVIADIAREASRLQPDVFVLYIGNNEVVGPFGPGTVFGPFSASPCLTRAQKARTWWARK